MLLERHGFKPEGGCALFQWLITPHAEACTNSWPGAAFCCACSRTTAACGLACLTPRRLAAACRRLGAYKDAMTH
jgi:hypothetical protein